MSKRPASAKGGPSDGVLALRLFDRLLPGPTWAAWRAWLCAVFGQAMSESETDIYRRCSGRQSTPHAPCREVWTIAGRRSGKSRMAAFLLAFLAGVKKWTLAPGEKPVVLVITPSRRQGRTVLDYAEAFVGMVLGVAVVRRTLEEIELSTGVTIMIQTASFRTPRGFTVVACVCDEIAYWRSDDTAANPDVEILRAVRPSLASVPGSLLIAISSPYAARGELHRMYERHYAHE
jgi:hypothetical protein